MTTEDIIPYRENTGYTADEYDDILNSKKVMYPTSTVNFPKKLKIEKNNDILKDTLKAQIIDYGAVAVSTPWNDYGAFQDGMKSYYYFNDGDFAGYHAITIIGWDDDISRSKFISSEGERPNLDGAWICLNSWGDSRT